MKANPKASNRRQFLLGATLGGAGVIAGAAALVTGQPVEKIVAAATPIKPESDGYRLTPHIQHYYDTTKL